MLEFELVMLSKSFKRKFEFAKFVILLEHTVLINYPHHHHTRLSILGLFCEIAEHCVTASSTCFEYICVRAPLGVQFLMNNTAFPRFDIMFSQFDPYLRVGFSSLVCRT